MSKCIAWRNTPRRWRENILRAKDGHWVTASGQPAQVNYKGSSMNIRRALWLMSGNPPGEAIRAGCDLSGCVKPDHCFAGNISSGMEIIVCNLTPEYAAMAQELLTDKGYAYEIEPNGELLQFTWQETGFVMEDVKT